RDQDLLPRPLRPLDHSHAPPPPPGLRRAHQAGRAGAEDQGVVVGGHAGADSLRTALAGCAEITEHRVRVAPLSPPKAPLHCRVPSPIRRPCKQTRPQDERRSLPVWGGLMAVAAISAAPRSRRLRRLAAASLLGAGLAVTPD